MDIVVGIDPSSKSIAIATFKVLGEKITPLSVDKFKSKAKKYDPSVSAWADAQVEAVMLNLMNEISGSNGISVFIEEPIVGRGGAHSTIVQAFVSGAIQSAFTRRGATVYLVHVSKWKKEVVGKGNATKEEVAEAVKGRWSAIAKYARSDQDMLDAIGIGAYGAEVVKRAGRI